jgi:peptidoglycan/xylan/chitin deacetylase (PgdA/CDA1 family)
VRVDAHQTPAGDTAAGYFLPSTGITDANGIVSFAYVINGTATPGQFFQISFSLPDTAESGGTALSIGPFGYQVFDPTGKNVFIVSGQGQVGRALTAVPKKMLVQLVPDSDPFTADDVAGFTIFGSNPAQVGSLEVVDGTLIESTTSNGQTIAVKVKANSSNQASVRLNMNTLPGPALVGVSSQPGGIFLDTFAVGPEEIRLLGGEAQGMKEPLFVTGQSPDAISKGQGISTYLLEVRTITGLGETLALGGVRSYDECNNLLVSSGGIPTVLGGIVLKKIAENERFATYRLGPNTPVIAIHPADSSSELPEGPHYVAVDSDGYLQAVTTDPAGNVIAGVLKREAKVRIAFTFDDGPTTAKAGAKGDNTGVVLDTLKAKKAKGTFFVEHTRVKTENGQKNCLRMVEEGHELAIHGVHDTKHHYSWAITSDIGTQLDKMIKILKILPLVGGTEEAPKGQVPVFARPPGGEATLKANINAGKVTSKAITNNEGETAVVYDKYETVAKFFSDRKLTIYLGEGTSKANSWLVEVPGKADGLKAFYDSIEGQIKKAANDKSERKIVVLSHDVRSFDSSKLGEMIDQINKLGKDHGVAVTFETMTELTK